LHPETDENEEANIAWIAVSFLILLILPPLPLLAQVIVLKGRVADPQGNGLPQVLVQLFADNQVLTKDTSGPDGLFQLKVASAGEFLIKVDAHGFRPVTHPVIVRRSDSILLHLTY
jgi:hypothetical protein